MLSFLQYLKELHVEVPKTSETKGISRGDMPQVDSKDHADLIKYLEKKGVKVKKKTVPARGLKATQKNFNKDKIEKAADNYATLHKAKPILVSSDNYIIDGHHRWLGALNVKGKITILQASVKVDELMEMVRRYPKSYTKNINESRN